MPSALIAALAAPIREVAAQVGPGWSDEGDPTAPLAEVRDLLADVSAAARSGWSRAADGWSGAGADGAADFVSLTAHAADRLAQRIDQLRASTAGAADAVARARSRLRNIINRFEDRAAAIEPRLDEPGRSTSCAPKRSERLTRPSPSSTSCAPSSTGTPQRSRPRRSPAAVAGGRPRRAGGVHGTRRVRLRSGRSAVGVGGARPRRRLRIRRAADLAALPLPDPDQFGDGVAVTLPDGSTATAPNAVAASAVRHALTQLGVPYVWGGTTPGVGLDCSGLTQWAYHEAGLDLPRLAQEQDVGAAVNQASLRPGDLAVWDGHVAMIVGNGMMIEAGDPVQVSPIRTTNAGQGFQGSGGRPPDRRHGIASAHSICPSKPSDVAIAR